MQRLSVSHGINSYNALSYVMCDFISKVHAELDKVLYAVSPYVLATRNAQMVRIWPVLDSLECTIDFYKDKIISYYPNGVGSFDQLSDVDIRDYIRWISEIALKPCFCNLYYEINYDIKTYIVSALFTKGSTVGGIPTAMLKHLRSLILNDIKVTSNTVVGRIKAANQNSRITSKWVEKEIIRVLTDF